jgi:hypothetical protein
MSSNKVIAVIVVCICVFMSISVISKSMGSIDPVAERIRAVNETFPLNSQKEEALKAVQKILDQAKETPSYPK